MGLWSTPSFLKVVLELPSERKKTYIFNSHRIKSVTVSVSVSLDRINSDNRFGSVSVSLGAANLA